MAEGAEGEWGPLHRGFPARDAEKIGHLARAKTLLSREWLVSFATNWVSSAEAQEYEDQDIASIEHQRRPQIPLDRNSHP